MGKASAVSTESTTYLHEKWKKAMTGLSQQRLEEKFCGMQPRTVESNKPLAKLRANLVILKKKKT